MLRALVVALLVANLAWWAWHTPAGATALGLADNGEREPQRLARQINAEQVQLVLPAQRPRPAAPASAPAGQSSATPAAAASVATTQCLEAGPLEDAAFANLRRDLLQAGVPADAWVDMRRERPATFALYMGRFTDAQQLERKGEELDRLGLSWQALGGNAPAGLTPGLTLGRYNNNEQAQARLKELQAKGVRTARVLTLAPASAEHMVRVDKASAAQQAALLKPTAASAATSTMGWRACLNDLRVP
jgi:hypothetical protein